MQKNNLTLTVLHAGSALTGGIGVDKAVDCSGIVGAHSICIDATRRKGHVAFVRQWSEETPIGISPDMVGKGLTLHGAWHYGFMEGFS